MERVYWWCYRPLIYLSSTAASQYIYRSTKVAFAAQAKVRTLIFLENLLVFSDPCVYPDPLDTLLLLRDKVPPLAGSAI